MIQILYMLRKLERIRGYDAKKAKKRAGFLRVFVFGCAVSTGVGTCALGSSANADVREASLSVGAQMMELSDLLTDPHLMTINGEQMYVASGQSKDDVKLTLDRFEAHCRSREGVTGELWRKITATPDVKTEFPEGSPLNFMRKEDDNEGMVVCLVKPEGRPVKPVMAAISEFAKTHDLGALGAMRYVFVRKNPNKGSSVITAWTENKFDFDSMLPMDGAEAPGSDSPTLPRPPGNVHRILAAKIEGTPYGVRVYQSSAKTADIYKHYDKVMMDQGWLRITEVGVVDENKSDGRGYLKDGVFAVVSADDDPNGGSVVSLGDLGGGTTATPKAVRAAEAEKAASKE